jgi:hypothetical protein
VKTYAEKLAALRAVERVAGVAAIANELTVVSHCCVRAQRRRYRKSSVAGIGFVRLRA